MPVSCILGFVFLLGSSVDLLYRLGIGFGLVACFGCHLFSCWWIISGLGKFFSCCIVCLLSGNVFGWNFVVGGSGYSSTSQSLYWFIWNSSCGAVGLALKYLMIGLLFFGSQLMVIGFLFRLYLDLHLLKQ